MTHATNERTLADVVATIEAGDFYQDYDQSVADLSILRAAANPAQVFASLLTPEQVADHIGVTPYSDIRPFVVQAVKYARQQDAAIGTGGQTVVKPLEWEDREEKRLGGLAEKLWRAQTTFDWGYRIRLVTGRYEIHGMNDGYDTLEAAKAAAKADYERRILASLAQGGDGARLSPNPVDDSREPVPAANLVQGVTELADLRTEIERKLPSDFPNYADWTVTLPAGHWRTLTAAIGATGQAANKHKWMPILDGTMCCQYCMVEQASSTDPVCPKAPIYPAPSGQAINDERKAFEAWGASEWTNGQAIPDSAWKGWQARAALTHPAPSGQAVTVTWKPLDDDGLAALEINGKRITTFPSYGEAQEVSERILSALTLPPQPKGE